MCKVSRSFNGATKEMNKTGDRELEIEGSHKPKGIAAGLEGANEGRKKKVAAQNRANWETWKQTKPKGATFSHSTLLVFALLGG